MKTKEQYIPWDAVPRQANRYMQLGVAHFEQLSNLEGTPVSVIVVSSLRRGDAKDQVDVA